MIDLIIHILLVAVILYQHLMIKGALIKIENLDEAVSVLLGRILGVSTPAGDPRK